ncbi:MAG: hypothetical protein IJK24_08245 [Oscillospiraceae bacterium]|nr:hypothetical protein [Oscillospiraceae bacterium]
MENMNAKNYGPITRDIYKAVSEILTDTCNQSISMVDSNCSIPDGYVKIPSEIPHPQKSISNKTDVADKVKDALCAVLPAGLSALGLAFNAPAVAVVVMTGAGGVASSFIQRAGNPSNMTLAELQLDKIVLDRLSPDMIDINIDINQEKKRDVLAEANRRLEKICSEISVYEEKNASKADVEINQEFGKWVQKFLMYVDANSDDRKLYILRNSLLSCLAAMNIHVYDNVLIREDGMPDVPIQDYLYDKRENCEEEYKTVSRPAVYSNRSLLARGEIL